jgi:hypothetical protein
MVVYIGNMPDIGRNSNEKGQETLTRKNSNKAVRYAKSLRTASHKPAPGSNGMRKSCRDYGCSCKKHGGKRKD